jgi:hypothetical protein
MIARRCAVAVLTVAAWWWTMEAVHESGHVLGCLVSGAHVERVVLWPWTFSETVRSGSRAPLVDTWAGPLFGMVAPIAIWGACRPWLRRGRGTWFADRLAGWVGFCLLANGVYLGTAPIVAAGDTRDLIYLGVPAWVLAVVGGVGCAAGLGWWHVVLEGMRRRRAAAG